MFDVTYICTLLILAPLAVLLGMVLGNALAKSFTTGYNGYPKCTHCGKRSLKNNSTLFLEHKSSPWICIRCRKPNRQVLVAATVKVKK